YRSGRVLGRLMRMPRSETWRRRWLPVDPRRDAVVLPSSLAHERLSLPGAASMRTSLPLALMFAVSSTGGCKKESPPPVDTESTAARAASDTSALPPGEARLPVDGGHIWYRVVGSGNATRVILLH